MEKNTFEYEICNVFDTDVFLRQCEALEKHIQGLIVSNDIEDVDGSRVRTYAYNNGKSLEVFNDKDFGVYIKSEFDIEEYFK